VRTLAVLAILSGCVPVAISPPSGRPRATLGDTFALDSSILGERRVINVYVPPGYATSNERYPVLYMPDGGMREDFPHVVGAVDVSIKNSVIRPVIVVGIENTDRRRDLLAATNVAEEKEIAPHAGGSDRFRAFLRDELRPAIAERYRATAETAIIGESFAGLFVLETFVVEPSLFDAYIAADPSLWWNEQDLVRNAVAQIAATPAHGVQIYIATADDRETQEAVAAFATALRIAAPAHVTLAIEPMPAEHHNTIFPTAALHGIRTVFAAH
jgi:predicted alpha/beta superfamily hydrolase